MHGVGFLKLWPIYTCNVSLTVFNAQGFSHDAANFVTIHANCLTHISGKTNGNTLVHMECISKCTNFY